MTRSDAERHKLRMPSRESKIYGFNLLVLKNLKQFSLDVDHEKLEKVNSLIQSMKGRVKRDRLKHDALPVTHVHEHS